MLQDCFNTLIDAFIKGEIAIKRSHVPAEFIALVFNGTAASCPLRVLMTDMVGAELSTNDFTTERRTELLDTHDDFVFAFAFLGRGRDEDAAARLQSRVKARFYHVQKPTEDPRDRLVVR